MSFDDHLAGAAVKQDGESLTVVQKIQGSGISAVPLFFVRCACPFVCLPGPVPEFRTEPEFVADAVFGAHQFGSLPVCQFVGWLRYPAAGISVQFLRKMVRYVCPVVQFRCLSGRDRVKRPRTVPGQSETVN